MRQRVLDALPGGLAVSLQRRWYRYRYPAPRPRVHVGAVDLGSLRRLEPVSRVFGLDRGHPVDRYYIESFLSDHRKDVRGRVLEVGDDRYTRRFGEGRVTSSDVLHVEDGVPGVTIVGDLAAGDGLPADAFDCVLVLQTLQFIYDVPAAVATLHRMLAPGGLVLATVPGISQLSSYDVDRWGEYWRFTSQSLRRLFEERFGPGATRVETYGNILAATAMLHGLAAEELQADELDRGDPEYEVVIAVRAEKGGGR